ncbi:MAG: hypothetical protein VKO21_06280 [Candidatus Sericytochromatia bacterium]|nr:hypothetical protein [Candidatus Sericytochromatia bacterium]
MSPSPAPTPSAVSRSVNDDGSKSAEAGILSEEVGSTPFLKGSGTYTHKILWSQRAIRVLGIGVAPDRGHVHVRRTQARIFALEDGFRTLRGVLGRLPVRSEATVADMQLDQEIRDRLNGIIQQSRVLHLEYLPDGSAQLELQLPLYGSDGVAGAMGTPDVATADIRPASAEVTTEASQSASGSVLPESPWTGILVDARALGAKPALWPRVRTTAGEPTTIKVPSWFNGREAAERVIGDRPLAVKARRAVGDHPCDLLLDLKDAERVRQALENQGLPVAILL